MSFLGSVKLARGSGTTPMFGWLSRDREFLLGLVTYQRDSVRGEVLLSFRQIGCGGKMRSVSDYYLRLQRPRIADRLA